MKGQHKPSVSKVLLGMVVLILFHLNLSALTYCNDSYSAFLEIDKKQKNSEVGTIKGYVVEGAVSFLESYSSFLLFFNEVELADIPGSDYNKLRLSLNTAIEKMEKAKKVYSQLKKKADVTPYNPTVIEKLLNFDFDTFQVEKQLIEQIFSKVKRYLCRGKIREMYGEILSHTEEILSIANKIKTKIESREFPGASDLHNLNEVCSKSLLFGQYASRVFLEIK